MRIVDERIEHYMLELLPQRSEVLREMEAWAAEHRFPIIGPLAGAAIARLAALIDARRVMELGSGFGYSALHVAAALHADARIICTDGDAENARRAREAFARAGVEENITMHVGDALTGFSTVEGMFDMIFCDIDKHEYPDAYRAALPRVRRGGLLIFDNALWSGRMLEGDDSASTRGVVELNRMAFADPACDAMILPLRDGLLVCTKR